MQSEIFSIVARIKTLEEAQTKSYKKNSLTISSPRDAPRCIMHGYQDTIWKTPQLQYHRNHQRNVRKPTVGMSLQSICGNATVRDILRLRKKKVSNQMTNNANPGKVFQTLAQSNSTKSMTQRSGQNCDRSTN